MASILHYARFALAFSQLQKHYLCNSNCIHRIDPRRSAAIANALCLWTVVIIASCTNETQTPQSPLGTPPITAQSSAESAPPPNAADALSGFDDAARTRGLRALETNASNGTDESIASMQHPMPPRSAGNLDPQAVPMGLSAASDSTQELVVSAPRFVGTLIGRDSVYAQSGLQLFGTDLGFTFEHAGRIHMLCGDSYSRDDSSCFEGQHLSDDLIATLPLDFTGPLPTIEVPTKPDAPTEFRSPQLFRDGAEVILDAFKVPITGFSDGQNMFVLFQSQTPVTCGAADACPSQAGVTCAPNIPVCSPAPVTIPTTCERCLVGECPVDHSVCVDTRSSQYDGSSRGVAASILSVVDIGQPRANDSMQFDSIVQWRTNTFSHPTVRTVTKFSGLRDGNDYSNGSGSLLIWGRPSMLAEQGREARLYFATQQLPLARDGEHRWSPKYYAGLEPSGEPHWSPDAADAKPLALDGVPDGDPHEEFSVVNTTSVSWLGEPIHRWVVMYSGDIADYLLVDPQGSRRTNPGGAVMLRFAEHPWGPWSPAISHFAPGSATKVGDPFGPGGFAYSPDCKDTLEMRCAKPEPYTLGLFNACVKTSTAEPGLFYAPNIVDRYTRRNENGGLDVSWLLSTWEPYALVMMQSTIAPAVSK
jgi:hypothetical protein